MVAASVDCFFEFDILNFQIAVYLLKATIAQPDTVVCNLSGVAECRPPAFTDVTETKRWLLNCLTCLMLMMRWPLLV